ncbi:hypothetical protein CYMTET_25415 [Cymbomonas tetramitiformis]|uniref:Uncharacterized protein n=1 Tax=Cymbomonas tetramitiformis TaxID=36881 RepID=A0AAE0KZ78_9CHLO|nr:hypothetical protein CYMTET_25415 [Cymbomonas tetramitiformis]
MAAPVSNPASLSFHKANAFSPHLSARGYATTSHSLRARLSVRRATYRSPRATVINVFSPRGGSPFPFFGDLERLLSESVEAATWLGLLTSDTSSWEEVEGAFVRRPPASAGPPRAVVHFIGGAFIGAAPQIAYRCFLEQLTERGVLVAQRGLENRGVVLSVGLVVERWLKQLNRLQKHGSGVPAVPLQRGSGSEAGSAGIPLPVFLEARELLQWMRDFTELEKAASEHWDNILSVSTGAIEQGAGLAEDRRKQDEQKRKELKKKVKCPTCHTKGHSAEGCFITSLPAREAFLKQRPETLNTIEKGVLGYKKDGKLPGAAAGAREANLCPGLADTGDVVFALAVAGRSETGHQQSPQSGGDFEDVPFTLPGSSVVEQVGRRKGLQSNGVVMWYLLVSMPGGVWHLEAGVLPRGSHDSMTGLMDELSSARDMPDLVSDDGSNCGDADILNVPVLVLDDNSDDEDQSVRGGICLRWANGGYLCPGQEDYNFG